MVLKHRAALEGVQMDGIDSRILITGILEEAGKENIQATGYGFRDGSRVTGAKRDYLDIHIRFKLKIFKEEMAARETLIEKINGWAAAGGWLEINYRENRMIHVRMIQGVTPGDSWNWTQEYDITFRAYGVPYWSQKTASSVTFSGAGSGTLGVEGNARSAAEVSYKNQSGSTIGAIAFRVGESVIGFSGLGLANGETVEITHDEEGLIVLQIRAANGTVRSVMAKRTPESDDELWVSPGNASCSVTPGYAGSCTVSCRGRWL